VSSLVAGGTADTRWRGTPLRMAEFLLFGFLPLLALGYVFGRVVVGGLDVYAVLPYTHAAHAILHGQSPYPALTDPDFMRGAGYVYPPLTAQASIPLTALPLHVAGVSMMVLLVGALLGTLWILGVRDWRCYGMPLLWPPVLSAIQTGNITLLMGLAAALVWRFRDREYAAGAALGISLAAKLFLWPVAGWMLATRRWRATGSGIAVAVVALAVTWGAIGFAGLAGYPTLLHSWSNYADDFAFSLYAVALDFGATSFVARTLWLLLALAVIAFSFFLGRRGDEGGSFVLALAAAIAFSPIVWLHYFALLLVVVAVMEQRLGPAWFAPLLMWITMGGAAVPAIGNGTPLQTLTTLAVAALTVGLALRRPEWRRATREPVAGSP
jgi:Glycosyltransferase family 87